MFDLSRRVTAGYRPAYADWLFTWRRPWDGLMLWCDYGEIYP